MLCGIAHRDFPFYTPKGAIPVGGALRDLLLGKRPWDLDFVAEDPLKAAEEAQSHLGGTLFPLDEERGQYRLVSGRLILDFSPLAGTLEEDLRRKVLVPVREENLHQDPLRSLRAVRLAAQVGLGLPGETRKALSRHAQFLKAHPEALPARERVREELARLLLSPKAAWGLHALQATGLLGVYLPELELLVGLEQGGVHHLDAWRHTLSVLFHLLWLWPEAPLEVRLAALFHDVGKPLTRRYDPEVGRFRFLGHAEVGAEVTKAALLWLRFPKETVAKTEALVRRHMDRLPEDPKDRRRFLFRRQDLLPHLVYLMAADRLGAKGVAGEAWEVLEAFQRALAEPLPTRPLLSGEEVMALLDLKPGPLVGQALEALLLAQVEGKVKTKEEARAFLLYWKGNGADTPKGSPDHPH